MPYVRQEMCQDKTSFCVDGVAKPPHQHKKMFDGDEGSLTISGQQAGQETGEGAALVRGANNGNPASM
jgi:hypothetical protein